MNAYQPYYILAAEAYGVGGYACGNFDEGCTAGVSTGTGAGGDLSYTGTNVLIPLALAGALIIAAGILVVTRLLRRRKAHASN